MTRTVYAIGLGLAIGAAHDSAQLRDTGVIARIGTAEISGTVVDDQVPAQPVRRAVVTLSGPELTPNRGAITDDEGRFRLAGLPAGRVTLTAARPTYLTSAYGAKRPGRPGTSISLVEGQVVHDLVVRLWRAAVIAGVVRDEKGAPVAGVPVTPIPAREGQTRSLLTLSNNGARTNDRGEYRIFGLEPGSYVISAKPPAGDGGPLTAMTEAQIDAMLSALRARAPGGTSAPAPFLAHPPPTSHSSRPFQYSPVYHPAAVDVDRAAIITLISGEERTGLDIALQRVPTATVQGVVSRPDGSPAPRATVELTRVRPPGPYTASRPTSLMGAADASGAFRIPQVPPGSYRLVARGSIQPMTPASEFSTTKVVGSDSLFATADVTVTGDDIEGLALTLSPGMTLSGRIVFASSSTPAVPVPDLRGVRVGLYPPWMQRLQPNTPIDGIGVSASAAVNPDGTFRFVGVFPATYVFEVFFFGRSLSPWFPKSALVGDRDLFDTPTELTREMGNKPLVVTFSDSHSELSGRFSTASGSAVSDVFVIAYAVDRRFWLPGSRRVQAVRPGADGRFIFADLPSGDYLLGAVTDVDEGEWFDQGFLGSLVTRSVKVTVIDGQKVVQDLQIGG